jgi:hypothetical protein
MARNSAFIRPRRGQTIFRVEWKKDQPTVVPYVVETFATIVKKLRGMSPMWDEFERGVIDSVIAPRGIGNSFSEHAAAVSGKAAH